MKALSLSPDYVMSRWREALTKTVLVMQLTGILLVAAILQVSAAGRAQTVTCSARGVPLERIFTMVEQETGYVFFFDKDQLQLAHPVTLELRRTPLAEALDSIFAGQPLTYDIQGNTIVVSRRKAVAMPAARVDTIPRAKIYGRVVDSTGTPLVGASVRIKGTKKGTSTNIKGDFVLPAPEGPAVIVVSYTSYETQEIKVNGPDNITVRLKYSSSPLDEVHVIAYGTTTERYNVGSINKVTSEQIEAQPVPNLLQALEGQVPGLIVTQSSGLAGASSTVQIRGQNTITSNANGSVIGGFNSPLFVVDGVPFAPQNNSINQLGSLLTPTLSYKTIIGNFINQTMPAAGLSPFSTISPDNIESIEVLKDADATAIYGSRGANGVILITTKKGKAGKTTVTATVQSGSSKAGPTVAMMNEQQYLQMRHEAYTNDGTTPDPVYAADVNGIFDTTKNTNWKKQFLSGTSKYTDAHVSLSGGTANDNFRVSSGYNVQNDMYPGNYGQNTLSFDAAFHHASQDNRLTMDFSGMYSYGRNNTPGVPSVLQAFQLPPDYPNLLDSHGNLVWIYNGFDLSNYFGNTLAYLKEASLSQVYTFTTSFTLKYKILPGLDISSNFGYNTTTNNELSEVPLAAQDPSQSPVSSAQYGYNNFADWIIDPALNYHKAVGRHIISAQAGAHFEQNTGTQNSQNGFNYANDALLGSIENAGTTSAYSGGSLYKRVDNFIRVGDIYNHEFILNVTGNRDATSRFGPGRQFGNFYSVAGGWIFSEWDWLKNKVPGLSYGKLRASYGLTGGDQIGDYQFQENYRAIPGVSFLGASGYQPLNLANPDYSWDQTSKLDLGLDIGLFKDRIMAGLGYYESHTGNQLINYLLPLQTGFNAVVENAPYIVQNKGWEFTLSARNIQSHNFSWTTSFNIGGNQNKLVSFPGLSTSPYANEYIVGQSTNIVRLVRFDGVNPQTGVFQYLTASGKITSNPDFAPPSHGGDETQVLCLDPKFNGGMGNRLTYKQFSLYIFCQFAKQIGPSILDEVYRSAVPGEPYNQPAFLLKQAWSEPGQQTNVEKFTEQYGSVTYTAANDYNVSTAAFTNTSYIRIKTVQFAYQLPAAYLKVIGIKACNINFSAQNLFTITRYQGDPETQNIYMVPPMKTVTLGINLTL